MDLQVRVFAKRATARCARDGVIDLEACLNVQHDARACLLGSVHDYGLKARSILHEGRIPAPLGRDRVPEDSDRLKGHLHRNPLGHDPSVITEIASAREALAQAGTASWERTEPSMSCSTTPSSDQGSVSNSSSSIPR